jgi:hypothetical protein
MNRGVGAALLGGPNHGILKSKGSSIGQNIKLQHKYNKQRTNIQEENIYRRAKMGSTSPQVQIHDKQ